MYPQEWINNRGRMEETVRILKLSSPEFKCLNLGCGAGGPAEFPNFINVDKFVEGPGITKGDLAELPFPDDYAAAVYSSHSLEHLPYRKAQKAIKEWSRVLAHGGKVYLAVPNLAFLGQMLSDESMDIVQYNWFLYCAFGYQTDPQIDWKSMETNLPELPGQFHLCGFTKKTLRYFFEREGFVITELYPYEGYGTPSLWLEAIKG